MVTVSEGLQLRVSGSATGYAGVEPSGKKYRARHKNVNLGTFDTAVEAAVAYTRRAEVADVLEAASSLASSSAAAAADKAAAPSLGGDTRSKLPVVGLEGPRGPAIVE